MTTKAQRALLLEGFVASIARLQPPFDAADTVFHLNDIVKRARRLMAAPEPDKWFDLYWSLTHRHIDRVKAKTASEAKRKAPQPYRKYLGEIYVVEMTDI
jgi:hypothetical protein